MLCIVISPASGPSPLEIATFTVSNGIPNAESYSVFFNRAITHNLNQVEAYLKEDRGILIIEDNLNFEAQLFADKIKEIGYKGDVFLKKNTHALRKRAEDIATEKDIGFEKGQHGCNELMLLLIDHLYPCK
jgi:hypothetical protein